MEALLIQAMKKNKLYTREELKSYSKTIDADLASLCEKKLLIKNYHGIYSKAGSEIETEQLIKKILAHSKSASYLIINPHECPPEIKTHLELGESTYLILNNRRSDTIETVNFTLKFQIPFNGFPKTLSQDFLYIYLMNTREKKSYADELLSQADPDRLKEIMALTQKYGNKSTQKYLTSKIQYQLELFKISNSLSQIGAPLVLNFKFERIADLDTTQILAKACEIAMDEPRIHNILPFTILKNLPKLDIKRFEKLTKDNSSYRYAGFLLDLLGMITPGKEIPSFKAPKYHPSSPIISFKSTYTERALNRIKKNHFDPAFKKWGILIDTTIESERDKLSKWQ